MYMLRVPFSKRDSLHIYTYINSFRNNFVKNILVQRLGSKASKMAGELDKLHG